MNIFRHEIFVLSSAKESLCIKEFHLLFGLSALEFYHVTNKVLGPGIRLVWTWY